MYEYGMNYALIYCFQCDHQTIPGATIAQPLLFWERFFEKQASSHWHISTSPSDCSAFTRHCLWRYLTPKPGVKHGKAPTA